MTRQTRLTFAQSGRLRSRPVTSPAFDSEPIEKVRALALAGADKEEKRRILIESITDCPPENPARAAAVLRWWNYLDKLVDRGGIPLGKVVDVVPHTGTNHWCTGKDGDDCFQVENSGTRFWVPAPDFESVDQERVCLVDEE